jgi:signal transduction histidine kinase
MLNESLIIIYFLYGLAFYTMGAAVLLEQGRGSDNRLAHALRPLAAFALIHGTHEWMEMFMSMEVLTGENFPFLLAESLRIALLSFSFLSLAAFGSYLLAGGTRSQQISMLILLGLAVLWGCGALILRNRFQSPEILLPVIDVWTRYTLGIPAALLASLGLIAQQRIFRQEGLVDFGRDSLWAAIAFLWYGLIGQFFTRPSVLFPSNIVNTQLFIETFGFPVQVLRAAAAGFAAMFIIRVLRAFDYETRRHIQSLQEARIEEAQHREALQRDLFKRVVEAQEAERQRIARELHDETGQSLTAIGLGLRGVTSLLQQNSGKAAQNLRQLETTTTNALTELQRLIADLRPSHLDDLGLPATLRWYAENLEEQTGLSINVQIKGDACPLSPESNTTVFRIFQEALTNIVKHANAQNVNVNLTYLTDHIILQVKDDGRGFDPQSRKDLASPTWGLTGMEERAGLLDGNIHILSIPGLGTLVEMVIPYTPATPTTESEITHDNTLAAG